MPELPEVETIRAQLSTLVSGLIIKDITIFNQKSFIGDPSEIIGKKIIGFRRVAKILIIDLSGNISLAIHLKMSGQLLYQGKRYTPKNLPNKHTRVIVKFTNGDTLYFNDQRKFGWFKLVQTAQIKDQITKNLGPDPLSELSPDILKKIVKSSRRPIKLVLMDQTKIGGVGNIYANDALFLAKIHPQTSASIIPQGKITALFESLKKVLTAGIKYKGASRNLYRNVFGKRGTLQDHFLVYDREDKLCIRCKNPIKKIKLGGRGTYFCPKCQR